MNKNRSQDFKIRLKTVDGQNNKPVNRSLLTLGSALRVNVLIKLPGKTGDYNVVLIRENVIHRPHLSVAKREIIFIGKYWTYIGKHWTYFTILIS